MCQGGRCPLWIPLPRATLFPFGYPMPTGMLSPLLDDPEPKGGRCPPLETSRIFCVREYPNCKITVGIPRLEKSPPPFKRVVCTRAISPPLLGQRLKALAFSFSYGNPAYAVFPQLRSSHIALDSSLPLKGHCYYLALTLKRVFIFFYT